MVDRLRKSFAHRSLLTDTLPYEVPVIFSNDRFHAGLSVPATGMLSAALAKIVSPSKSYTIPYNYEIAKDDKRQTTLSIVHPSLQLEMSKFYELHAGAILGQCDRGRFSLRRPVALASPFARELIKDDEREKSGIPQLLVDAGEADMAHLSSYFVYGKHTLLRRFIDSREYIRLEGRYKLIRQIDVSKCFYNIYTHSVTWSVKSKSFAKQQRNTYSFESEFDKLMQRCNYNETNGIVVGPEFSRIFAEIIFQDIDERVEAELRDLKLLVGSEYDVRRYVDDYFVFANDPITLDRIESCLRRNLERYKLYVNEEKVETRSRPFVSSLTLAREEISGKLREISSFLGDMKPGTDIAELRKYRKAILFRFASMRLSVAKYEIKFANVSGWLMSRLRQIIRGAVKAMQEHSDSAGREALGDVSVAALETALYVCSVDLRVRTTYLLCQIALVLQQARTHFSAEHGDLLDHLLSDNISGIVRYRVISRGDEFGKGDDVELCNLLICGAHFVGRDFLISTDVERVLTRLAGAPRLTYFNYISLAFCMRKAADVFSSTLHMVHAKARDRVLAPDVDLSRNTEEYLLAVDYLAAPEVAPADKQSLFQLAFKHSDPVSFANLAEVSNRVGFSDLTGVTVEHQLRRKELQPAYAWG